MSHIVCQEIRYSKVTDYAFVRRILVPFNDARPAPNVIGFAMTLAKIMGASITIVSVGNKDLQISWVNGTPSREKSISLSSVHMLKKGIKKLEEQAKKFQIQFDYTIIPSRKVSDSILFLMGLLYSQMEFET